MKKIFKSVMTVTVIGVATRLTGFAFKILLSRRLGAEGIGRLQICLTFLGALFCVCSGGIPVTVSRKTALLKEDKKKNGAYLTTALLTGGGISLLLIAVSFLFKNSLSVWISDDGLNVFLALLPSLFAGTVYSVFRGWFWGQEKFTVFSLTEMAEELVRIVLVIIVFALGVFSDKLFAVALSFSLADVLSMIALVCMFFFFGGRLSRPKYFKELAVHSTPVTGERILGAAISTLVAFLLPKLLMSGGVDQSEATADYGRITAMAATFLFAPSTITGALSTVLVPKIAVMKEKSIAATQKSVDFAISFCVMIAGLFAALYFALGSKITTLFYNDERSGEYLTFCAAVIFPLTLNGIMGSVLNSVGKEKKGFVNFAIGNLLFVTITLCLVKTVGWYSYGIGQFIGSCVVFALNCRSLGKEKVTRFAFFKTMFLTVSATAMASVSASLIKNYLLQTLSDILCVVFCVVWICLVYLFFLIFCGAVDISFFKKSLFKYLPKYRQRKAVDVK